MNLPEQFIAFLNSQKKKPSKATVKNYKADVLQFIHWFEKESKKYFSPALVTSQTIELYKKEKTTAYRPQTTAVDGRQLTVETHISLRTMKRHLSSLRKFFHFLKIEGIAPNDPFEEIRNPQSSVPEADPWHIRDFKNYLYVYNASALTIKNYIMDVKQFMQWAQKVTNVEKQWQVSEKNIFNKLDFRLIEEYKQRLQNEHFSPLTINRKLSSLRKYMAWAKEQGFVRKDTEFPIFPPTKPQPKTQPLGILPSMPPIAPQIKYIPVPTETVRQATPQEEPVAKSPRSYSRIPPIRLGQMIILAGDFIFDFLFIEPLALLTRGVEYIAWKLRGKPVFKASQKETRTPIQVYNVKKGFYAQVSTQGMSLGQKTLHHLKYTRPKWYIRYHSYAFVHYLHFGALVILMCILGFYVFQNLNLKTGIPSQLTQLVGYDSTKRTLIFQGKLADSQNNPITNSSSVKFTIYDDAFKPGGSLWTETLDINPKDDGTFSVVLGNKNPLYQELFVKNYTLWLGITIGSDAELTPRQQLANVALSEDAQTLDGLPLITQNKTGNKNVVLALDSSGNLTIGGEASSTFQAIGGGFTLSGNVLTLTTVAGTNSDIVLSPDGLGKVDITKQIFNSSNSSTTEGAAGAVEIADSLFILASSSAQSAFTVNQTDTGPIISASSSGIAKFTVDGLGNTTIAGDLILAGSRISAGSLTDINFASSSLQVGAISTNGNFSQSGNTTFSTGTGSARLNGDVFIGTSSANTITFNGRVAQNSNLIPASASGVNDLGSGNFPWSTLYVKNVKPIGSAGQFGWWTRSGTTLSTANSADNLSIGGTLGVTGNTTLTGDLAVNGGDITSTATSFNLLNSTVTTLNFGGAATTLSMGAATGTFTVNNATLSFPNATDLDCVDCVDFDDMSDALTIDSATTLAYTGAGTSLALTNSGAKTAASTGISVSNTSTSGTASINKYALQLTSTGTWNGTSAYAAGLEIQPVTGGTNNVALCFDCDGTWTSSTVASGIQFGTDANAVNLYRSASDTLRTDDSLYVGGSLTVSGIAAANGDVDLGDTASDTVTFVGVVDSNILADANNTRNLGSSSVRWNTVYATTGDFTNIAGTVTTGSTSAANWTINSDNETSDAEISSIAFETGSATFNAVLQWNSLSDAGRYAGYDANFVANYPISIISQVSGGNQTFTSGSLFNYGQSSTHAITQGGAFVGVDIDFSSNITNATQNQTGVLITLKDGSSSGTAIGFQTAGTMDYGLDIGGTIGTHDIRLSNGETINNTTNGTLAFGIDGTNEVSLTATALSPSTTDGTALGTTSLMWSDLFLASGGVINFNNGDITLTHGTNALGIEGGSVGIGDPTPDALLDIDSTDTDGGDFLITNTGIGLSGSVAQITSNSTTTGDIFTISATGLTTGDAFKITGPSGTGIVSGTSAGLVSIASDVGSAGTSGVLVYLNSDFSAGSATTSYGIYNNATDSTAVANTNYGYYGSLALTGNADKTGIGLYSTVTSSSTTADTLIALDLATSVTGIIAAGTGVRDVYGIRNQPSAGAESTADTTNVYGEYVKIAADVAAGGTVNGYGLYVANGTFDTDGTSKQIGLYVESPTGADTNYAAVFAGGNIGVGITAPTAKLHIKQASDSFGDAIRFEASGATNTWDFVMGGDAKLYLGYNSVTQALIDTSGNLSLGNIAAASRLGLEGTGVTKGITFGDGAASPVTLYRNANDELKTDDALTVALDLIVSGGDITGTGDESIDIGEATTNAITFLIDAAAEVLLTSSALSPSTSDGNALGTTSLMWADLFLASGSVINLNNGDVTLTHGTDVLTIAGGDLNLAAQLDVEGYAAIGNGSAPTAARTLIVDRAFSVSSGDASQLLVGVNSAITATGGVGNFAVLQVQPGGVTINSAGTHAIVASARFMEPNITETSGSVTTAATVLIDNAPTEGDNNYALFVDAGASRFDGNVSITGTANPVVTLDGSSTSAVALRFNYGGAATFGGYMGLESSTGGGLITGTAARTLVIRGDSGVAIGGGNRQDLYINTSGAVGIGTITPGGILDVSGAFTTTDTNNFFARFNPTPTATGNITLWANVAIDGPSVVGDAGTRTLTDAASLYIEGAPAAGANAAITRAYALWVDAGDTRLDGLLSAQSAVTATAGGTHRATDIIPTISGTVASATTTFDAQRIAWTQNMTGGANTITDGVGLRIANPTITFGAISNNYGIRVDAQTSGTGDYGIRVDLADTQTLWVNGSTDSTTAAGGIAFGSSRDTNLYRSAANTLKTDDDLTIAAQLDVEGYAAIGNGSAPTAGRTLIVDRDFSVSSGDMSTLFVRGIQTFAGGVGNTGFVQIQPDGVVIESGGTHDIVASLKVTEPVITETSGSVTNAVTVYIADAPTEGTSNWALWVDSGNTRLDGNLRVPGMSETISAIADVCWASSTGELVYTNTNTCAVASSQRFKENIQDLGYGLSELMQLRPVFFNYKPDFAQDQSRKIGFIAEESIGIIPEVVHLDEEGLPYGMSYENLTALLAKAIQEQQVQIETLAEQMASAGNPEDFSVNLIAGTLYEIRDAFGIVIEKTDLFATAVIANLRAGAIEAQQVTSDMLQVTSDNFTVAGQSIRDYIAGIVNEIINNQSSIINSGQLISPLASIDQIHTNLISPIASSSAIAISLEGSQIAIRNSQSATASAVAEFDNIGNARFQGDLSARQATLSGNLLAQSATISGNLNASEATVSGTLRADKIIANNIEGQYVLSASESASLTYVSNLSAETATFNQGIIALGPSSLMDTSVVGQLSINTSLVLANNSINVLGADLQIQPFRQGGISFLSGLIYIDTEGNATFDKDITVKGKLAAGLISPLPDKDLIFNLPSSPTHDSQLTIRNSTGSAVLSVNNAGDLIASGSATVSKLKFNFVAPALALSPIESLATGSAGVATISAQQTQLTVRNPLVSQDSLIYITPVGNPNGQTPYLLRQTPNEPPVEGSFTAGIQLPSGLDTTFNWLIVN